jgi:hypothetical protein
MRVTWRDGVTTLLTVAMVLFAAAMVSGWDWPLVGSGRAAIGILAIVGLSTCIVGGAGLKAFKGPFVVGAAVLGFVAFGLVVSGLISGSQAILVALTIDIVALWLVATLRHAIERAEVLAAHEVPRAA